MIHSYLPVLAAVVCAVYGQDSKPCFNIDSANYVDHYLNKGLLSAISEALKRRDSFQPSNFTVSTQSQTCTVQVTDAKMKLFPLVHIQKYGVWSGNDSDFDIYAEYYGGDYTEVIAFTANCSDGITYKGKLNVKVNNYQAHTYKKYKLNPSTGKHDIVYHELLTNSYGNREYSIEAKLPKDLSDVIIAKSNENKILATHDALGNTLRYYDTAGVPSDDVDKYISYDCNYHPAPVDPTLSERVTKLTRALNKAEILKTVI